ncbi:methyltransferase [Mangrovibacter sp. MFB070]|uniref:methyltransferase n=1 Tax=Mangrovibacter sp. MFB070 TaxID=1224318 RepID=UPI0004D7795F|nr:methyltransferase [Mangrovibacter sp. MFB070]KEA51849.1 methyltransferase [Mangrovibacter sp. MFB070]
MGKLTKKETKLHQQVMDLVHSDRQLTFEEKEFILNNYAGDAVGATGAFFTPEWLGWDFTIDSYCTGRCLELCAGIGRLSFCQYTRCKPEHIRCVELNPEYVQIGKRVLPEAEWITGDALTYTSEQRYDIVYGNPPFGKINTSEAVTGSYSGSEFEYKVITKGAEFADYGVWIVPQGSAGFVYSGVRCYERRESPKYKKFVKDTGWTFEAGCGVDTSIYKDEWHGTSVICEVVTVEYSHDNE